jgi:hypothetical protein
MRGPKMESLLAAWETGRHQNAASRGITLLGVVFPASTREALGEFTVGERDRWLLQLRRAVFGMEAAALTSCPRCGESLELDVPVGDIPAAGEGDRPRTGEIARDGYRVHFHVPRCKDLVYASRAADVASAAQLLLERCVEGAEGSGEAIDYRAIPAALVEELEGRIEEMDAQGEIRIALECPACSTRWAAVFDIVSFLWTELDAWAVRLLRQVHALASAYGWVERDILGMSDSRREFYLDLVGG